MEAAMGRGDSYVTSGQQWEPGMRSMDSLMSKGTDSGVGPENRSNQSGRGGFWRPWDLDLYVQDNWHPSAPRWLASCNSGWVIWTTTT